MAFASASFADDVRTKHFKGLPAPDLAEIHVLSYTLENALEKINEALAELADSLEEVHVASETFARDKLKKNGELYLQASRTIVKQVNLPVTYTR